MLNKEDITLVSEVRHVMNTCGGQTNLTYPNTTSDWCNVVVGIEMRPPTQLTTNFSPTSRQRRATKLGIQAGL